MTEFALPSPEKVGAVIPAAGKGERLPGPSSKQFRMLAGCPLVWHAMRRVAREGRVGSIVLVLPKGFCETLELPSDLGVKLRTVEGGERRQDSVACGLVALPSSVEWVVVHDGARPLLPPGLVTRCLEQALDCGASIAAVPMTDTVKRADENGFCAETLSRNSLWLAQTPQVSRRDLLERALRLAEKDGREGTDESAFLEAAGVRVRLVPGERSNLKVTVPEDIFLAEALLACEASPAKCAARRERF